MARRKRSAADFFPKSISLSRLRAAAEDCRGCDLYKNATQTVFGEGRARAPLMLVGEVPGDKEDREGHPFVGPAGTLLRKALEQAGISLKDVYLTNAVKHFKYIWRGKRRIHQKPKRTEIVACRPWLQEEIELVRPELVVALGSTAAQTLLGASFRLTKHRGEVMGSDLAPRVMATIHPSAILRAPDERARHQAMADFVADLKRVRAELRGRRSP
ncbi:MAG: UdgX family uracil-DNA binding protein [Candidatus Eremiobacteraeota bacterium]|nr:UdgX family uracil-DNA binding protein [Candidatus Eremiobacteraeota bacterium]